MAELAALPDGTAMALAVCVALLVDILWGEPPSRCHPVVWMGHYLGALGRRIAPATGELPAAAAGAFVRGALAWAFGALLVVSVAVAAVWALSGWPQWLQALALGVLLKPLLAWRMLRDEVRAVEKALAE